MELNNKKWRERLSFILLWEHFHLCLLWTLFASSLLHQGRNPIWRDDNSSSRELKIKPRRALGGLREKGKQEVPNFAASSQAQSAQIRILLPEPRRAALCWQKNAISTGRLTRRAMRERTENSLSVCCCVPMCFSGTSPEGGGCQSLICALHFVSEWASAEYIYMREPLSCRAHLDRSSYAVYFPRAMHAQQKSSPVSHSIELENITLGLHFLSDKFSHAWCLYNHSLARILLRPRCIHSVFFLFRSSHAPLAL